jgi:hypothetical protein
MTVHDEGPFYLILEKNLIEKRRYMKRRLTNLLAVGLLVSIVGPIYQVAFAQTAFNTGQGAVFPLPSGAIPGSNSERAAAWNGLTSQERADLDQMLQDTVTNLIKKHSATASQPVSTALSFSTNTGVITDLSASVKRAPNAASLGFSGNTYTPPAPGSKPPGDYDHDGLVDTFENALADGFTPTYYVSAGENGTTGFATFTTTGNPPVPAVLNTYGSIPPISYFRVTPLGFANINGNQNGFIQIDYLTLWNEDDGLNIGTLCTALTATFGLSLSEAGSHPIDNERSAILIAAPSTGYTFNSTPSAYKGYQMFTAAHEDTFFDNSMVFGAMPVIDFGEHPLLGLARSKHSTYPFIPDNLPLVPDWLIAGIYDAIALDYLHSGDWVRFLALMYAADTMIYTCVVEHHQNQGPVFAGTRINVGELVYPLNNSGFIQTAVWTHKLNKYF